jgi:hypothetical protein
VTFRSENSAFRLPHNCPRCTSLVNGCNVRESSVPTQCRMYTQTNRRTQSANFHNTHRHTLEWSAYCIEQRRHGQSKSPLFVPSRRRARSPLLLPLAVAPRNSVRNVRVVMQLQCGPQRALNEYCGFGRASASPAAGRSRRAVRTLV